MTVPDGEAWFMLVLGRRRKDPSRVRFRRDSIGVDITLQTPADVIRAIAHARSVTLSAYVLTVDGRMARALSDAADRGARVAVTLDGAPYFGHASPDAVNPNVACADALRAHGVAVRLSGPGEPAVHLKAAVIDGNGYLDDRNWPTSGRDTVVETSDPVAVAALSDAIAAIEHDPLADLALHKEAALALEAETIRTGGDRIDVATESYGAGVVSAALAERARAGAHVRIEVDGRVLASDRSGREHRALARLAASGVEIRAVAAAEKFALADGRVWLGSANASPENGTMRDWGVRSDDPRLAATLAESFARAWSRGRPIDLDDQAPKSASAVAFVAATTSASASPSTFATYAAVSAM